jgi:hypothetical protein
MAMVLSSWITVLRSPASVHPPNLIRATLDGRRIGAKRVIRRATSTDHKEQQGSLRPEMQPRKWRTRQDSNL